MRRTVLGISAVVMAFFIVTIGGVDNVARGQTNLPAPTNVAAADGINYGEATVSWTAVAGAVYYRIGWIAAPDLAAIQAQQPWPYEDYWLEAFHFVDIQNRGQTSVTITRLTPRIQYAFIVSSNDNRYGAPSWAADWSPWLELASAPTQGETGGSGITAPPTNQTAPENGVSFDGSRYESISSGSLHSCGVRLDGTVGCFGSNGRGQSTPPEGEFLSVSAGGAHTCGVKAQGTVVCWGSATVPSPPPGNNFKSVSSGDNHSCGVTPLDDNGQSSVICWSEVGGAKTGDIFYSTRSRPYTIAESVNSGGNHNCAVDSGGNMRCWGSNDSGQVASGERVKAVAAGGEHTCWLYRNGIVACKGNDTSGQSTPPVVPEGDFDQEPYTYTTISAGDAHTCAINGDGNATQVKGSVRCWGSDLYGQSTPPAGIFESINAGAFQTCGLRQDGTITCWGDNTYGQAPR